MFYFKMLYYVIAFLQLPSLSADQEINVKVCIMLQLLTLTVMLQLVF